MNGCRILKNLIFNKENVNEISQFLKDNDIFESIENCIIESTDLPSLGASIFKSRIHKILHLNFSNYEWTTFASFCSIISQNESLEELDLSGNYIGDDAAISINEIILSHKGLKNFNLNHNNLSESSCKSIVSAMELNTSIQTLNILGNYANSQTLDDLATIIARNRAYLSKSKTIISPKKLDVNLYLGTEFPSLNNKENDKEIFNQIQTDNISSINMKNREKFSLKENNTLEKLINEDKSIITEENYCQLINENEDLNQKMSTDKNTIENLEYKIELLRNNCLFLEQKNKNLEQSKINISKELEKSSDDIKYEISNHFFIEKAHLIDDFTQKLQLLKTDNDILNRKNM